MMHAEVVVNENGFLVKGEMTFDTVLEVRALGNQIIRAASQETVKIDFSGVTHCDVAALSLIARWLQLAKHCHRKLQLASLPTVLNQLAGLCGLSPLLADQTI